MHPDLEAICGAGNPAPLNASIALGVGMIAQDSETEDTGSPPIREFAVVKRSVMVGGQKTSVSLEDAFWASLKDIAARRGISLSRQLATIDAQRSTGNLSSAIRLYVLDHFRARADTSVMIGERRFVATQDRAPLSPR